MHQMRISTNEVSSLVLMALYLVFIQHLIKFLPFFRISNFFDLSITEEICVVEMRIWYIKIGIILV